VIYRAPESQDVAIGAVRVEGFEIEAAAAPRQSLAMLGMGAIGDDLVEARVWPMSALSPQHGRLPFDSGPVRAVALPPLRAISSHKAHRRHAAEAEASGATQPASIAARRRASSAPKPAHPIPLLLRTAIMPDILRTLSPRRSACHSRASCYGPSLASSVSVLRSSTVMSPPAPSRARTEENCERKFASWLMVPLK
jgi:hypothetical protein